jgi:hypothetical protein
MIVTHVIWYGTQELAVPNDHIGKATTNFKICSGCEEAIKEARELRKNGYFIYRIMEERQDSEDSAIETKIAFVGDIGLSGDQLNEFLSSAQ